MTEEDLKKLYRPKWKLRLILLLWFFENALCWLALHVAQNKGLRGVLLIYGVTNLIWLFTARMVSSPFGFWAVIQEWKRYNYLGHWAVYTLDFDPATAPSLKIRVEEREKPNALLNSSSWAVYRKLGGWGGKRVFYGCRSEADPHISVQGGVHLQIRDGVIRLKTAGWSWFFQERVVQRISLFLWQLEVTNGVQPSAVIDVLLFKVRNLQRALDQALIDVQRAEQVRQEHLSRDAERYTRREQEHEQRVKDLEALLAAEKNSHEIFRFRIDDWVKVAISAMSGLSGAVKLIDAGSRLKNTVEGTKLRRELVLAYQLAEAQRNRIDGQDFSRPA